MSQRVVQVELNKLTQIEKALMEAELLLDGLKTHIAMRKEACPLYHTPFHKKVARALNAVHSARNNFRIWNKGKQWTITTRSKAINHDPSRKWECPVRPDWRCPFCHDKTMAVLRPGDMEGLQDALVNIFELDWQVAESIIDGAANYDELAAL